MHDPLQDTKLANAAAWDNLTAGNEEEDGQKGNEEDEDNGDGLWNNFQSRDDQELVAVRFGILKQGACFSGCAQLAGVMIGLYVMLDTLIPSSACRLCCFAKL